MKLEANEGGFFSDNVYIKRRKSQENMYDLYKKGDLDCQWENYPPLYVDMIFDLVKTKKNISQIQRRLDWFLFVWQ